MKISVITVTYNAEEVLLRTLKSVERQSFKNIEHLIIDGASKDGTLAIAEEYKQRVSYDVTILSEPALLRVTISCFSMQVTVCMQQTRLN